MAKLPDISYDGCRCRQCCPMPNQTIEGTYSFALTPAQTKSVIMGNGDTWQEDNAIFFQAVHPPWQRI